MFDAHVRTAVAANDAAEGQDQHRAVSANLMHPRVEEIAHLVQQPTTQLRRWPTVTTTGEHRERDLVFRVRARLGA